MSGRKKTREPKEENVTLGPTVREGEYVFGVAHIFASFNDTFIFVSLGNNSVNFALYNCLVDLFSLCFVGSSRRHSLGPSLGLGVAAGQSATASSIRDYSPQKVPSLLLSVISIPVGIVGRIGVNLRADAHQDLSACFGGPIPDSPLRCLHCGIGFPVVYDQYGASAFSSASAESFILATLYHFKLECMISMELLLSAVLLLSPSFLRLFTTSNWRCLHCGIGFPVVYDQQGASAFCSASAESFILATLYHVKLEVSTFWK
ncbi:hypothetical protein ABZP36_007177 [Zizania latifolia]